MAASATFALKAGVWFRRVRRFIVSPDSLGTACPQSGRNSTYRPVQISGASSLQRLAFRGHLASPRKVPGIAGSPGTPLQFLLRVLALRATTLAPIFLVSEM